MSTSPWKQTLYFLGVGGAGMYPLARLALDLGYRVIGADRETSVRTESLSRHGAQMLSEQEPLPPEVDRAVFSLAVSSAHPRLLEARARGIPILSRAELLGELLGSFPVRIAVAGMHGKSSTVGMLTEIMHAAGLAPTVLAGATLAEGDSYLRGAGDTVLVEACEYGDSFLSLSPTHAVVLNVEWEHTDYFPDEEAVITSFRRFVEEKSIRCLVMPSHSLLGRYPQAVTFGEDGVYRAEDTRSLGGRFSFEVREADARLGRVSLSVLGRVQIENALACVALCRQLGIAWDAVLSGLTRFSGVARRMEYVGHLGPSPLYLDYAHHPTELAAALATAREMARRVVLVFEAHTYSRVHAFRARFAALLSGPEKVGILPIYAARETDTLGLDGAVMAADAGAEYLPSYADAAAFLLRSFAQGTLLLLVGAGGVTEVLAHLPTLATERKKS